MAGRGERGEGAEHGSELEENPFVGWEGREHNVTQRTPTGQRKTAPRLIWGCPQSSSCSFPGDLPKLWWWSQRGRSSWHAEETVPLFVVLLFAPVKSR